MGEHNARYPAVRSSEAKRERRGADAAVGGRLGYESAKRVMDVLGAGMGMVLLGPLALLLAILVKLDGGPVIFRQERLGKDGKPFALFKFRSMREDAPQRREDLDAENECEGPVFKIRRDPRITRVGAFLRRSSLDELPQLWNILRGEMSLVGPRPPLPTEVACYEPWQRERLAVKPGLTCIWQVSGRSNIPFEEWVRMDIEYIRRRNIWLDLRLLLLTIPAVITGRGAY
jgi:lipopolysaccharide/colanic/teichoic acid biosynthesis glycosyltransferase